MMNLYDADADTILDILRDAGQSGTLEDVLNEVRRHALARAANVLRWVALTETRPSTV